MSEPIETEDIEALFATRPVRLGDPSRPMLLVALAMLIAGGAWMAFELSRTGHRHQDSLLAGALMVGGLYRLAVATRYVAVTRETLRFHGWFGVHLCDVHVTNIKSVEVLQTEHGDGLYLKLVLGENDHEAIMADPVIADWLDAHGVFVPDFGTWRGTHGRGHPAEPSDPDDARRD